MASKVGGHAFSDATSVKIVSNGRDSGKAERYEQDKAGSHQTNMQSRNDNSQKVAPFYVEIEGECGYLYIRHRSTHRTLLSFFSPISPTRI